MGKCIRAWAATLLILAVAPVSAGQDQNRPAGEWRAASLQVADRERDYYLYVPATLTPEPALIIVLHGAGSNPERIRAGMVESFDRLADEQGLLVVYPAGHGDHWNDCKTGMPDPAGQEGIDDVGFLTALLGALESGYGVPASRRFLVGMSNGGEMVYRMALERPEAFTAYAAIAASLPVRAAFECEPKDQPVSILILNGTEDPINPWAGGEVDIFGQIKRGHVLSAPASASWFVELAGGATSAELIKYPAQAADQPTTAHATRWQTVAGSVVQLVTIEGGGHTFPHPEASYPRFFGPANTDINAAAVIWDFFQQARSTHVSSSHAPKFPDRLLH